MKVVILCGGLGTRLREETEFRPKPLIEIGGRPILWHIMKIYAHYGFKEFVLCLGYKGNMIREYFLNYEAMNNDFTIRLGADRTIEFHSAHEDQDLQVTLADTGMLTNTGGRIKRVERYLDGDTFMVTYGDGVGDVNIPELLDFHRQHGRLATVTAVQPVSRFGLVDVDEGDIVKRFVEKPEGDGWASAGFFVFDRRALEYLDEDSVLEREPLERLAADGQIAAYRHSGFWQPMDTYRESKLLNDLWEDGRPPWAIWLRQQTTR